MYDRVNEGGGVVWHGVNEGGGVVCSDRVN